MDQHFDYIVFISKGIIVLIVSRYNVTTQKILEYSIMKYGDSACKTLLLSDYFLLFRAIE